jgi:hypothetical protein
MLRAFLRGGSDGAFGGEENFEGEFGFGTFRAGI